MECPGYSGILYRQAPGAIAYILAIPLSFPGFNERDALPDGVFSRSSEDSKPTEYPHRTSRNRRGTARGIAE
jgi:hypothetical protein